MKEMRRASAGRRVARAAATGGGRTYRSQRPLAWYAMLVGIVILGTLTVVYSRYERQHAASKTAASTAPPTATDHWFAAIGFDLCGKMASNLPQNSNLAKVGIATIGNGVIQIAPGSAPKPAAFEGANATLGKFASSYPGMLLTATKLRLPGQRLYTNGDACGNKHGRLIVRVWKTFTLANSAGKIQSGDPRSIKLENGQLITVAFVPVGTTIPKPPALDITDLIKTITSASQSNGAPPTGLPGGTGSLPSGVPSPGGGLPSGTGGLPSGTGGLPSGVPSPYTGLPSSTGHPSGGAGGTHSLGAPAPGSSHSGNLQASSATSRSNLLTTGRL